MVCHGPDPPDSSPQELTPQSRTDLLMHGPLGDDSDEDQNEHFGYEPLPQGPEAMASDHDSEEEMEATESVQQPVADVPTIESMDTVLAREVWNTPRSTDPIQMDNEKAEQVMSAMANFVLPATAIPEWAQSMTEEQWKQTLKDRLQIMKGKT